MDFARDEGSFESSAKVFDAGFRIIGENRLDPPRIYTLLSLSKNVNGLRGRYLCAYVYYMVRIRVERKSICKRD